MVQMPAPCCPILLQHSRQHNATCETLCAARILVKMHQTSSSGFERSRTIAFTGMCSYMLVVPHPIFDLTGHLDSSSQCKSCNTVSRWLLARRAMLCMQGIHSSTWIRSQGDGKGDPSQAEDPAPSADTSAICAPTDNAGSSLTSPRHQSSEDLTAMIALSVTPMVERFLQAGPEPMQQMLMLAAAGQ